MFELTKEELLALNSEQLRELVGRLCEAELDVKNMPTSAVHWGGANTAPDGGIDVEVRIEEHDKYVGDFVPRPRTGIQVKTPDLTPAGIAEEMAPNGQVRPMIRDIISAGGAYLIISLGADLVAKSLGERCKKMQQQIEDIPGSKQAVVKFCGRNELATWLRKHITVQMWVRQQIGLPLSGWNPFGRWAQTPVDSEDSLIIEDGVRIWVPNDLEQPNAIVDGVNAIRKLVRDGTEVIRIIGHSGVGKTRIAQALFEEDVGEFPLEKVKAIYADLGSGPTPSPEEILDRLIPENDNKILVLDNCPPDEHDRLTKKVASARKNLRLITIEHDVRSDWLENTDVVRIVASGTDATQALLRRRFPDLGSFKTERAAALAEGNARLALVLAKRFEQGGDISSLPDETLFRRIFDQGDSPNLDLHQAAEALSLVYSFSIEANTDGPSELEILGNLIDRNGNWMHSKVQDLIDRGIAQERRTWRAILPQAIANRLAEAALKGIPLDTLREAFERTSSPRMLMSFARRLNYLYSNDVAQEIVQSWLSPGGILFDLKHLDNEQALTLYYAAPIAPEAALNAIEKYVKKRSFVRTIRNVIYEKIAYVLLGFAYDEEFFERCVEILSVMAIRRRASPNDRIRKAISNLFSLRLSGTKTKPIFRSRILRRYLNDDNPFEMEIGIEMLKSAFRTEQWVAPRRPDFGERVRDYGYIPRKDADVSEWYKIHLDLFHKSLSNATVVRRAKLLKLFAQQFRGLWKNSRCRELLFNIIDQIISREGIWIEGWKAVRKTLYHDYRGNSGDIDPEGFHLLDRLSDRLEPQRLEDRIRALVEWDIPYMPFPKGDRNQKRQSHSEVIEVNSSEMERLGELAASKGVLDSVLPNAFNPIFRPNYYVYPFGKGIARHPGDHRALWKKLAEFMTKMGDDARHPGIMIGVFEVINGRDPELAQQLLDEAVEQQQLRNFFIELQQVVPFDERGIGRINKCLEYDDFWTALYGIAWRPAFSSLPEETLAGFLGQVVVRPNGGIVALGELSMRFHNGSVPGSALARVGLSAAGQTIKEWEPTRYHNTTHDHCLKIVLEACLSPEMYPKECKEVLEALAEKIEDSSRSSLGLGSGVQVIAQRMPCEFLDILFKLSKHTDMFLEDNFEGWNPLNDISSEDLISWAGKDDRSQRLQKLARWIHPFTPSDNAFTDQALTLIQSSQDPSEIIEALYSNLRLFSWVGNFSDALAQRRAVFAKLAEDPNPLIRSTIDEVLIKLDNRINKAQNKERESDQKRYQTFE